jgi:SAM-dependent methyltransferase
MISYICPLCSAPLDMDGDALRCHRDGYINIPRDGVRDFLTEGEEAHHARFIEEYREIRSGEGRGSNDAAHYLALPSTEPGDPKAKEWRLRAESMEWLRRHLESARPNDRRAILDAGAGNCWLTRYLAAWGNDVVALDLNLDPYDGLLAGRHYLDALPITFERVRADFAHLPFADRSFDILLFNGALHYAEDLHAAIAEAVRATKPSGEIIIIDSPIYRSESSGLKMLAERERPGRARFLTFHLLEEIARDHRLTLEIDLPPSPLLKRLKRRITEIRLGREIAVMGRMKMKCEV